MITKWILCRERSLCMSPLVVGIIGIIALLVLLFIGMNIAFSMIVVGFVGYAFLINMKAALGLFATIPFNTVANYGFSVIPLFVLMEIGRAHV